MPIDINAARKALADEDAQRAREAAIAGPRIAPPVMARAQEIGAKRSVPPLAVAQDIDAWEDREHYDSVQKAAADSPAFGRWVQQPGNAAVSRGSTSKLSALSLALEAIRNPFTAAARVFQPAVDAGIQRAKVGETFQRASAGVFANTIESATDVVNQTNPWRMLAALPGVSGDVKAKANDPLGVGQLQAEAAGVGAEIRLDDQAQAKAVGGRPGLDVLRNNPSQFVEQATAYYMGQAAQSAPSMIAGMATRRPMVGGGIMGGTTAANTYSELRSEGVGRAEAWAAAGMSGAMEVGSEALSMGNWVKGRFIKSVAEGATGEALAGATQLEIGAKAKGEKTTWSERVDAVLDSAILGGAMDASMTAGHIALSKPDAKKVDTIQRLGASGDGAQKIGAILDAARDVMNNKVAGASTLAREAAGESHVYLAADQARVLFQSERATADQFVGELVGDETALAEAEATGGDIAIPMTAFVERISQLPNADEIARHLRIDPEQLSRADLEDETTLNGWLDELDTDAAAERAKPENVAAREQVSSDVLGMLMASGRYREADAQLQANLVGRVFDTLGSREGRSAWELYSDYKLKINGRGGNQVSSTRPNTLPAETDSLLTDLRGGTLPSDKLTFGISLIPFVKKMGGLQDFRGELKSMDANLTAGLVKTGGADLDYAREAAAEAGYLPEDSTVADFLELIDKELRGEPVYSAASGDQNLMDRRNKADEIQAAIDQNERLRSMPRAEFEALSNQELHDILFGQDRSLWQKAKTLFQPNVNKNSDPARLLAQQNKTERGQLAIGANRQMEVTLFDGADMSTFVHELGHLFLEVMQDQALRNPELKADLDQLRAWAGNDGGEFTADQHEQIARGFEAYLREGRAPAPELRSMFGRMRAWLVDVYKSLVELNVDLTDDVRGVFDRIIASDEEIEAAQVKQGMAELPVGDNLLTPEQLAKYRENLAGATEEARARAVSLMNKAAKRQQMRWWKDELRALKAEAQKKFDALPEVIAWRAMQGREGTPEQLKFKLSREAMVARYGKQWVKDNLLHLRVYSADGGVHPDTAAAAFGFDSGDALLRALANVKDTRARMMEAAEALMRERHGDPMTDGTLPEKAMDFVHGTRRVKVLETELALLSKLANEPVPPVRAIREYARRKIAALKTRSIRPNEYLVAERKAANAALKAAAAGNWSEALKHKRAQAVQSILYSEARKAQARAQSTIKMLKAAAKPSTRKRVGKAGKSYVEALDAILSLFELRTVSGKAIVRREALRQWVARMQENDQNTAIDSALLERVEREDVVNLADLTGAELEAVRESVSNILALARLKTNFLTKRGKMGREEAKVAMIEAMDKLEARDRATDADRSMFERLVDFKDAVGNWLLQPETIIEWLDKGTKGIFHDLLWLPSNQAEAKRNELKRAVGAQLEAAFAGLSKESRNDLDEKRLIPSLNRSLSGHTILSALLNTGNAQNRAKLEGGGIVLGDEIVQLSPQALAEMFATLNAEQVRLAQGIWDSVNSLWPHIVEMEEAVSGFAPPKVESQTVTVQSKDGPITLTGGYYPIKYDPRGSKFGLDEADEQAKRALAGQAAVKASTSKGHLEKRTEYLAPLKLDYHNILTEHLSGVMSDIAYRRYLAQVFTILSDPDISRRIDGRLGPQATKHLRRAFERGAVGNVALAGPLFGPLQGVANTAMTNVAVAALGLRVPLALANIVTAPMLAASRISPKWLVQGFTEFYKNPSKSGEMIRSLSDVMRKRAEAPNVDYQAVLDNLKGGNSIRRQITELSMSVHRWIVPLAENAIWLSGYKEAIAGGASIAESVDVADKLVVQTQTKSASKDLSALEANPYLRPLMMFAGPLVVISNRLQDAGLRGGLHGDVDSVPQALGVWLAMAAGGSWAFELMMGRGPDDDDNDGLDAMDWVKWCALKLGLMPFSAIPVLRDAASYVESGRAPTSPLASATVNLANAVKIYKNLLDDEKEVETSKVVKVTAKAVSTVVPLPTNQMIRTGEYVMAVGTGEHAMENPAKEAYYLLQGPPKD